MWAMLQTLAMLFSVQAPAIHCQITMTSWCIVQLPSIIELADDGKIRRWKISLNKDVSEAVIVVSEDKFCDGELQYVNKDTSDTQFVFLTNSSCGLRINIDGAKNSASTNSLLGLALLLKRESRWIPAR